MTDILIDLLADDNNITHLVTDILIDPLADIKNIAHLMTDILIDLLADNKNITPASPEDVAKAIAEAQCKLSTSQRESPQQCEDSGNAEAVKVKTKLAP